MIYDWEVYFTVGWLALWFLFPLGIFLSVGRLDKNSDELNQIVKYRARPRNRSSIKTRSAFHVPRFVSRH